MAKNTVKIIRGNIAPSDAAAMGFEGINSTIQSRNRGKSTCVVTSESGKRFVISTSILPRFKREGAATAVNRLLPVTKITNHIKAFSPTLPTFLEEGDAIPETNNDTTKGITVMRIEFTHNLPIGVPISAKDFKKEASDIEVTTPIVKPIISARRT
tara:strand:+ start:1871 stop:2338 length:468 start_codon:yes stop_codon:yes gene_type:complete